MAENSGIEWTDHTFNPWWGCQKVSPGCKNCYAETHSKRYGKNIWGPNTERMITSAGNWKQPRRWNREAETEGVVKRVFTASMADVFEDRRDLDEPRARLFALVEETPYLQWLVLSKRPDKMLELVPTHWQSGWPANTVAMTSVEDQRRADERIPQLLQVPATLRGLSCEPLLGPVDLEPYFWEAAGPEWAGKNLAEPGIDWVITGGESGSRARPTLFDWYRQIRDDCEAAGVAYFHKQHGEWVEYDIGAVEDEDLKRTAFVEDDGSRWYRDLNAQANSGLRAGGLECVMRVGKKTAGRVLDGLEHSEFPVAHR